MDIYNTCLFRMLNKLNNTGPPDAVLYDMPLGWWDPDWAGCQSDRKAVDDDTWHAVANTYLASHTRYPKNYDMQAGSPLQRVLSIVEGFFEKCKGPHCLPLEGMNIVAYEAFKGDKPWQGPPKGPWQCYLYADADLDAIYGKDRHTAWSEGTEKKVCESRLERKFTLGDKGRTPGCATGCSCCMKNPDFKAA